MRILAVIDEKTNELAAIEVIDVDYDAEEGCVDFLAVNDRLYYIPKVSLSDSNDICRNLVIHGYCDVTRYGELMEYTDDEDNNESEENDGCNVKENTSLFGIFSDR